MKQLFNLLFNEWILAAIACIVAGSVLHFVTDDYAYFMSSLAGKQFSDFAYFDVHFQGYMGVREIYKVFYHFIPSINWHFVFALFFEWISLVVFLRAFRNSANKSLSELEIRLLLVAVSICFFENIVFVSHTRVSLIFCGVALFNLAFTEQLTLKNTLLNSLLFLLGMLLRSESGIGMLLLTSIAYFIYSHNIKTYLHRFAGPLLFMGIFLTIFYTDLQTTSLFSRKIEPEIEYKMMANRVVPISEMKTAKDSVKYEAARAGMWFDTKEVSPEFMRSLLLPGAELSVTHAFEVLAHVLSLYKHYPFVIFALAALFIISIWRHTANQWLLLQISALTLCTFAIIYMLDYNGLLVEGRHFLNLQLISLLVLCFYVFSHWADAKSTWLRWPAYLALLLAGVGCAFSLHLYYNSAKEQYYAEIQMEQAMRAIEKNYHHRILAFTLESRFLMDRHFTLLNKMYNGNTYLMFDWFTFGLTPRYVDYMSRTCGCNAENPVEVFNWMAANKVMYVSTPHKFELTERYMKAVHHLPLQFTEPVPINNLGKIDNYDTQDCQIRMVNLMP